MEENKEEKVIFYCKTGWMKRYQGPAPDDPKPIGAAKYLKEHVGYEVYNFLPHNGTYYGFFDVKNNGNIDIKNLGADKDTDRIDNVLVVWTAKDPKKGGIYVVGWYRNATVYKQPKQDSRLNIPERYLIDDDGTTKNYTDYRVTSNNAILVPEDTRTCKITGIRRINHWFDEDKTMEQKVLDYINNYGTSFKEIEKAEQRLGALVGSEKETIIKSRVNQGKFRDGLLQLYPHCCLCGVDDSRFLVASHIKPWSESSGVEKLDLDNGFLMCPNHDSLFDSGYISFSDDGKILISSLLSTNNMNSLNVKSDMKIQLSKGNRKYLNYHRNHIFKK